MIFVIVARNAGLHDMTIHRTFGRLAAGFPIACEESYPPPNYRKESAALWPWQLVRRWQC